MGRNSKFFGDKKILLIDTFEAGEVMMVKQGVRKYLNPKKSVLPYSMLRDWLLQNGLTTKGDKTDDIINVSFNYGTVSAEMDEKRFGELKSDIENYKRITKEELREIFYKEGITINGKHYVRFFKNVGSAKKGSCLFIREDLYKKSFSYLTMGIGDKFKEDEFEKVIELESYSPLIASGIEFRIPIKSNEILVVDDISTFLNRKCKVMKKQDDEIVITEQEEKIESVLFDGQALIEDSICPNMDCGMFLLRTHFFKACAFRTHIQKYIKDYCEENGIDYNTFKIKDRFGNKVLAKKIRLITTENACKFIKLKDYMPEDYFAYWKEWVDKEHGMGVVKTDHPSKYGSVQRLSYQMINSSLLTYSQVKQLAKYDIERVTNLKVNDNDFLSYLEEYKNDVNCYSMILALVRWNKDIIHSDFVQDVRDSIVKAEMNELRKGRLRVEGDNCTMLSNGAEMLQYAITGQYELAFENKEDCIQCYSTLFDDKERLCAWRSPQNAMNNVIYFENKKIPFIDKYFNLTKNIVVVNSYETDLQERGNSADFDSDFVLVTNNKLFVKSARRCYKEFLTLVNNVPLVGANTYRWNAQGLTQLDIKCQKSQNTIGSSSNVAQIALSYYHEEPKKELEDIFLKLACACQCAIDGIKREYDIDPQYEIAMAKKQLPKDLPYFFKIVANRKNHLKQLNCPMDFLGEILKKDLPRVKKQKVTNLSSFRVTLPNYHKCNYKQVERIIHICQSHSNRIINLKMNYSKEDFHKLFIKAEEDFQKQLVRIRVKDEETMNVIIKRILTDENYVMLRRKVLNALYKIDERMFLMQFFRK